MNARMSQAMGRAKSLAGGFTPGQRGILLVAVLALVLGAVALTKWVAQPTWTPLYGNLSGTDANSIVEVLQSQGVQYKLSDGGATILVPQSQVYDLRVAMAGKNLPSSTTSDGWSILDKQGMTATEFQQNTAYQRALEGELDKTLQAITGVNTAIVHLTIPKKDVFTTEQDSPTAAVLLSLAAGTTLTKSQVRSITHLVAGSVPGLDASKVTVSDSSGNMLTSPSDSSGNTEAASEAGDADEQTSQYEDRVAAATQKMLDTVLGEGNSVVTVSAQLDFASRHSTTESYLASPVTPLSEQTTRETYGNGAGAATGGTLGVATPTPLASGASGGSGYLKEGRTVNNGVGKSIVEEEAAPGSVKRLSVAVVVDSKTAGTVDTAKLQQLVASAVGVDSTRGDVVQVDAMPFDRTNAEATKKELAAAQKAEQTAGYLNMGKKAGMILLAVIVGIVLMIRRRKAQPSIEASASDLGGGVLMPSRLDQLGTEHLRELSAGPSAGGMLEGDPVLQREKLREEVSSFMDGQPEEIAQLVQGWLSERSS